MTVLFFSLSNISSFSFLFCLGDGFDKILHQRAVKTKPTNMTAQQSDGPRPVILFINEIVILVSLALEGQLRLRTSSL